VNVENETKDEIDLYSIYLILWRSKKVILTISTFIGIVALLVTFFYPRVFVSTAILSPTNDFSSNANNNSSISSIAALAGLNLGQKQAQSSLKDIALKKLQGRDFFENQIFNDDDFIFEVKKFGISSFSDTYNFYEENLIVEEDEDKGFITISFYSLSPESAKFFLDLSIKKINQEMLRTTQERNKKALNYLYETIKQSDIVEVRTAVSSLIKRNVSELSLSEMNEDFIFSIIDSPRLNEDHVYPQRLLIFLIGFIFSMLVLSSLVILLNFRNETLELSHKPLFISINKIEE
tara:strand:+ start:177 stop:1052 length:876 start_codon:yes stop_codon:yes gene_type:complete